MIRLVLYFILVLCAAAGVAWLADRPGTLTVEWLGNEVQTTVFLAVLGVILFFAILALAVWLGVLTWTAPRRFARRIQARKTRIGNEALRRGIFAAGAGDRAVAQRAGAVAKRALPEEPLTLLLEAQAAQLNEDGIASRQAFERMLEKPQMVELGLRGLFMEARKSNQQEAAKQFAERALAINPALSWSSAALFEMACREGDWRAALKILGMAKQGRHIGKSEADRRRALLLTALASDMEDRQQGKALAYALEAYGLMPSLTPAAIVAGRILAGQGNVARATKVLSAAWRVSPHPDLALIYAHARTGDSPRDRLARVKSLVSSSAPSLEGDIAVAAAAVEAQDWATARTALAPHIKDRPQARVCRLMARIEAGQNRDAGRAREWLSKALRAAPDPMWVGPDGAVATEWRPALGGAGILTAFEWKAPTTFHAPKEDEQTLPEITALDFLATEPIVEAAAQTTDRPDVLVEDETAPLDDQAASRTPETATGAAGQADTDAEYAYEDAPGAKTSPSKTEVLSGPAKMKALPAPGNGRPSAFKPRVVTAAPAVEPSAPAADDEETAPRPRAWYYRKPAAEG